MRRASYAIIAAAALAAAGCSGGSAAAPDFQPSPTGSNVEGNHGVHIDPIMPTPSLGGDGAGSAPSSGSSSSAPSRQDPFVVATKLTSPVGLSLLPDGTALVGERTTGRIVRVQPRPGQPVPTVRTLHGLDTTGDGGLLDLAVSPHYSEDNLVYAYLTTKTDNRVVDFTLHGPVTPVLTGIPKGTRDNSGRLAFAADGSLYVGTGDAGRPGLAARAGSLAGKVLRIDDIGSPAAGNPVPSSPVFDTGHRVVNGICPVPDSSQVLDVESGTSGRPDVVDLMRGGGYYGWPTPRADEVAPVATLPAAAASPSDCAILGSRLWVTSLDGKALFSAAPRKRGASMRFTAFTPVLHDVYGRLRTVVAAPDGALWLTTSNRDGHGTAVRDDERVIRYLPQGGGGAGNTT